MHEILGWVGATLFSGCAIPQAWQSYKEGHSRGLNNWFLGAWLWGEILTLIYVWPSQQWPLIVNYVFNLALLSVIIRYKVKPRETP